MAQDMLMNGGSEEEQTSLPNNNDAMSELQRFSLLAKAAESTEVLTAIILQVLEASSIYVFGELLLLPNIEALKESANSKYYNTLHLFAYGTYKQYTQHPEEFIELNAAMQKKLQHLTLVTLAIETKSIPYERLLGELGVETVRSLEDLIIEAIYADMIHGKLIQNQRLLEIDYAQGRDVPPGYISKIKETFQDWVDTCDNISGSIFEQILFANAEKAKATRAKEVTDTKFANLKKVVKAMAMEEEPLSSEPVKVKMNRRLSNMAGAIAHRMGMELDDVLGSAGRTPARKQSYRSRFAFDDDE